MTNKIVFVNQATGYITIDIVNSFAQRFEEVGLIAGKIRTQSNELNNKVKLSQIVAYNRSSPCMKVFSWLTGTMQILLLLLIRYRKYEVFYFTNPPFAYLLSLFLSKKVTILVFDVYPDALKIFGINRNNIIYRIWSQLNKRTFRRAHKIYTIGNGLATLLKQYVELERLTIIPLWTGLTNANPISKQENPWLQKLNLENKFIIEYSGNIGYTHNIEVLIEIANLIQDDDNFHFLIIGRGERVKHIRSLIEKYSLANCTLLPYQHDNLLVYALASADLGVVILDEVVADVSLPSKIYNLQAVGVPILGISPPGSELERHINEYKIGKCFSQSDLKGMVDFIRNMNWNTSELQNFSNNAIKASIYFAPANAELYYQSYIN